MVSQLNAPVHTLNQLKSTLELLHQITDLQNVIDSMYHPVEKMYSLLRYSKILESCIYRCTEMSSIEVKKYEVLSATSRLH